MASPALDFRNKAQTDHPGSVVVERGRNYIKHQKPDEGYILDVSLGAIHYGSQYDQEIDTAWVDSAAPWDKEMTLANYNAYALTDFSAGQVVKYVHSSGESIAFQPQQLQFTNDLDQIQSVGDVQSVSAAVDDDELNWLGAFGTDLDFTWETQTSRLAKQLVIDNLTALGTPAQYILDGGNPVLRLQFIFQVSQNVDIYINGEKWDKSKTKDTTGTIEFKDASTGEVYWQFNPGYAQDESDEDEIVPVTRFRKQANRLYVEVRTPWFWLETAAYPVIIDPSVDDQVGAGDEDAWESDDSVYFQVGGIRIQANSNSNSNTRRNGGFFFNNITVTNEATIDIAYTTTVCEGTFWDDPNINIRANDVNDAVDFTSNADVTTRVNSASTTNYTEWSTTGVGIGSVNSPSITSVIKEVVDRPGWSSGNDMVILFEGRDDANYSFGVKSYEKSTTDCAKLHIEYTDVITSTVSVSDGITIADSPTVDHIVAIVITVSDGLTLGESVSRSFDPSAVDWPISETDGITMGEMVQVQIPPTPTSGTFIGKQETSYEVWLCDQYGRRLTIVDNLISFEIVKVVNDVSYCSLTLPGNFHATYKTLIGVDYMIEFWRHPAQGDMQLESVFFVRDITYEEDTKGNDIIVLAGPDGNDLLNRRIVAYYAGSSESDKTDNADDMMKEIVRENLGSTATTPRDLTDLNFTVAADVTDAPSITKAFSWRNVLDVLQDIAAISAENETDLYFDIKPKIVSSTEIGFEFMTYTGQPGQNRTYDGDSPVIFSKEWGNLAEPVLKYDYTKEANVVYGGGQGEGEYRTIAEISDDTRVGSSIWNRRERFADARNETTANGVSNKAEEVLRQSVPLKRFTGKLLDTPQTRYGVDWFFGDKVVVSYQDIQLQGIAKALRIRLDKEGNEILEVKVEVVS